VLFSVIRNLFKRAPKPPHARFEEAFRLYREGRLDEAERTCAGIGGSLRPDVDYLSGLIAQARGDLESAVASLAAAVGAREDEASFRYSFGQALEKVGRYAQASLQFERFIALADERDPRRLDACLSAAECQNQLGSDTGAMTWYERAATAAGGEPRELERIVFALFDASRVEKAREVQGLVITRKDELQARVRRALLLPAIYASAGAIEAVRQRLAGELDELLDTRPEAVSDPDRAVGVLPFYLAYHNATNRDLLRKVCAVMQRIYRPPGGPQAPPARAPAARLRVGFVSTFFYSHSVGRATIGLIRDLPRDRFEVHVFAIDPADDVTRSVIERAADCYRRLPRSVEEARRSIADAGLDVLVFADIGMHPITYFLAMNRLAPIQVATWGHSETSGIDTIDYYLSAAGVEIESAQSHYSETLVRPDAFFLPGYQRPVLDEPVSRESLGLPASRPIYACLQPLFKLHPDMDAIFAGILERDPHGELLLPEGRPAWREQLRQRLASAIGANAGRVRFLPRLQHRQYISTIAVADVILDPLYFGGCNSSCEALALGVPIVTLPGTHLYGRFTLGLYREMGFEECVVDSIARYVDMAIRITTEKDYRSRLGREIEARSAVLFERRDATLAFADFMEKTARSGPGRYGKDGP
jgi:protein O-GlcNAc transferase